MYMMMIWGISGNATAPMLTILLWSFLITGKDTRGPDMGQIHPGGSWRDVNSKIMFLVCDYTYGCNRRSIGVLVVIWHG
jgi:hypothetical protein